MSAAWSSDPIRRQQLLLLEDAIPHALRSTWVAHLFGHILQHPASTSWRTSRTARQICSLLHKFLRVTGLLADAPPPGLLPDTGAVATWFGDRLAGMADTTIRGLCDGYNERFCASDTSHRTYTRLQNLLFREVWPVLPEPLSASARRRRRFRSLAELDDALSTGQPSAGGAGGGGRVDRVDHLTAEQVTALERAAEATGLRERLMVGLLLTTGLRRQGLVNIKTADVARWDAGAGVWRPDRAGETWEKGQRRRSFPLYPPVRDLLQLWLGSDPPCRPPSPSEYLFPSAVTNNGQMSADTVRVVFRALGRRAGLPPRLCHAHVMRHTCAHRLLESGNDARQIAAYLGHMSSATTEKFYLRDSVENITAGMRKPDAWQPPAATTGEHHQHPVDHLRQVLEMRQRRQDRDTAK